MPCFVVVILLLLLLPPHYDGGTLARVPPDRFAEESQFWNTYPSGRHDAQLIQHPGNVLKMPYFNDPAVYDVVQVYIGEPSLLPRCRPAHQRSSIRTGAYAMLDNEVALSDFMQDRCL
jgi:hypothetical protein